MRWLYRLLIRLHPAEFRDRFEEEMLLTFDETVAARESTLLLVKDLSVLLFRRWVVRHVRTSWLLASCAILNGLYSVMNFFMVDPDGGVTLRTGIYSRVTHAHMGQVALAAGVVTVAVGLWTFRDRKAWFLVLNGLSYSVLGLNVYAASSRSVGFQSVAILMGVMGLTIGIYELATARTLPRHCADKWFFAAVGGVSLVFAAMFLGLAYGWFTLVSRPFSDFVWFGSYFAFTAICMLRFALRFRTMAAGQVRR